MIFFSPFSVRLAGACKTHRGANLHALQEQDVMAVRHARERRDADEIAYELSDVLKRRATSSLTHTDATGYHRLHSALGAMRQQKVRGINMGGGGGVIQGCLAPRL